MVLSAVLLTLSNYGLFLRLVDALPKIHHHIYYLNDDS